MKTFLAPLALALAAAIPATASAEGARRPVERIALSPADELVHVVRTTRTATAEQLPHLEARLARIAPAAVDRALDVLATRKLPALQAEEREQTLSEPQTALLLGAYAGVGRDQGWAALERWLGARRDVAVRTAALQFASLFARARDLPRLAALANELPNAPVDARLIRAWEDAVVAVAARDVHALPQLAADRGKLHADLVPAYLRALGRSRDERAYDALDRALERYPEHAMLALAQVRLLPLPRAPGSADALTERLRRMVQRIDPGRPELVQSVLMALGGLEDAGSVELLLDYLSHEAPGIAKDARWALERVTGKSFGADIGRWTRWLEGEREWYASERPAVLARLQKGRTDQVTSALRELVAHRLYRHELADDVAALLDSPSADVRAALCLVLGGLGSPRAITPLADALDDESPAVARAAHAALRSITGRDLPESRAECLIAVFTPGPAR